MSEPLLFRILVAGPVASGKTTFIEAINEIDKYSVTPDLPWEELTRRRKEIEHNIKLGKVMDFGRKTLEEDLILYFLGAPRLQWYDEVMPKLTQESFLGYIVTVDSTDPATFREAKKLPTLLHSYNPAPLVVAANKQDKPHAWSPDDLRIALHIPQEIPVVPCIATDKAFVKNVLLALLTRVLEELDD